MKKTNLTDMKPTIGLEIHIELNTNSKMFCGCPSEHFAKKPNTNTCPVCIGLPGALPVPNKIAVDWTIMLGLAVNCSVKRGSKFDRKHYFYPDLPKGYQISQYDEPFCVKGYIETSDGRINITRVHLEEDTGKLQHTELDGNKVSLVDFNRSGVPLVEIVTEPDIHSGRQAKDYAQKLQAIARYLGISDCDMEKGSMRLEANISWGENLNYKVEIKNLNSFRFVEKAIDYELNRQKKILENGETPKQETRGWNENKAVTYGQRSKEEAADYRYFPEPDIPPMKFPQKYIDNLVKNIPELPDARKKRFVSKLKVPENFAEILVSDKKRADYFEEASKLANKHNISTKMVYDVMVNQKLDEDYEEPALLIKKLVELTKREYATKSEVLKAVEKVVRENKKAVKDFEKGKGAVIGFLIGQVQKILKGKGEVNTIRNEIESRLKK